MESESHSDIGPHMAMDLLSQFNALIRSSGLSQGEIARRSKLTPGAVSKYISGDSMPSIGAVERITEVCGARVTILAPGAVPDPLSTLTPSQRTLIEKIDQLDAEKQALVLQVLETLVPLEGSTLGQRQLKQWVENFGQAQAVPAIHQASEPAPVRLRSWEEKEKDQVMMPVKKQTQPVARGKKTA